MPAKRRDRNRVEHRVSDNYNDQPNISVAPRYRVISDEDGGV